MANLLTLSNVSVSYGAISALKNANINVEEGKIVALLGANGAGKSSTLKAISGLVPIQNGEITFGGEKISGTKAEKIVKKGLVHCPEGRQIFGGLTTEENLMIGAYVLKDKKKVAENLEYVFEKFPILKERRKQVAGTLSGGEQQMLAIGRGLMASPKLLILDEPSLGLAPLIVKDIFNIIKSLNDAGTTILIVEQNATQTLKIADYAYVLEVGTISNEGKASDLLSDPKIVEAYLGGKK